MLLCVAVTGSSQFQRILLDDSAVSLQEGAYVWGLSRSEQAEGRKAGILSPGTAEHWHGGRLGQAACSRGCVQAAPRVVYR